MSTSVKEQLKTDWQKAQEVGTERLSKIGKVFKSAASEAFSEVKAGSSDMQGLSREALAKLIAQLKEQDAIATPPATSSDRADSSFNQATETLPSWRQLLVDLFGIVRDRSPKWFNLLRQQAKQYSSKVDQNLTTEYGDRYQRVKDQLKKVQTQYQTATNSTKAEAPAKRVEVEILD